MINRSKIVKYCKKSVTWKILLMISVLNKLFTDVITTEGQGMCRDRYKNTLGTVGCCPFDSPFPAIIVFLSARASTSFLSVLSLASSFFRTLSNPPFFPPCTIYDPVVFSYAFNPSFFSLATLGPPTRREENTLSVCVYTKWRRHTRSRAWR